jgi:ABC-2 type transport system ATP-binding protein
MNNANPAIEVTGLRKSYDSLEAVAGIDLRVERGEVFALLGPNGAGKTTAVEILEGHRTRSGGEVSVLGFDPGNSETAFKERIGIVLQESGVDPYLTVEETLDLFRSYYPHPRPREELLRLVSLEEQRGMRVLKLSGGQQRRLDVAVGLAGDPDLLFLDEPTTGFDPAARHGAWEMVRDLQKLGKTIFLTTHYMEEAEELANRVAIIRRGTIVAEGTPGSLLEKDPLTTIRFRPQEDDGLVTSGIAGVEQLPDGVTVIKTLTPTATLAMLTSRATDRGVELSELTVTRPTLEDTYLRLVGEEGAPAE